MEGLGGGEGRAAGNLPVPLPGVSRGRVPAREGHVSEAERCMSWGATTRDK